MKRNKRTKSEEFLCKNAMKTWHKSSSESKISLIKEICGSRKYEVVGDFTIIEGAVLKTNGSIVMHVPSGLWKGVCSEFEIAVKMAMGMDDCQILDTILWLHELD